MLKLKERGQKNEKDNYVRDYIWVGNSISGGLYYYTLE